MNTFPSHKNSINGRNERRANQKEDIRNRLAVAVEPTDKILESFCRAAVKTVNAGLVSRSENRFYIKAGKSHYTVYLIRNNFRCECNSQAKYGDCTHQHAARLFAEREAGCKPACFWCLDQNITDERGRLQICAYCERESQPVPMAA